MLGRIYNLVAILAIAHLVALGGVVAYLFNSGKLSPERVQQIAELLRTADEEPAEDQPADKADKDKEAEEPAPTEQPGRSAEQIAADRHAQQLRRAAVERAEADLRAQRQLLEQVLVDQIQKQEAFDRSVQNWKEQKKKLRDEARDAGFQRELEYFSKLPPKQAKEILVRKFKNSPADAVRLLNAVKTSVGQSILETMKSPEEIKIMYELLEQLGKQDIDRFVPGSGKSSAGT